MKTALIPALEDVRHRASRLDLESDRNDLPLDGDASLPAGAAEDGPASRAGREDADILKEIARQIREGALSARPTRNTASGSTPSASNIAPEWRSSADSRWIGIACTPLSAPGFPGARSRPFRQARARTQDTVDCNRRRCRDHARRASRRNGQRAIPELRRRYSRKRHARSRCDHVAAIGKRQAGRRDVAPYRARSQRDRGTHGIERPGVGRIARVGACLRCRRQPSAHCRQSDGDAPNPAQPADQRHQVHAARRRRSRRNRIIFRMAASFSSFATRVAA